MGVESIDPKIRKNVLLRNESNEDIINAIRLFKKYHIRCITDNLLGLPGQDESEYLKLAKFYNENRVDRICIFWLIYYPGTEIVEISKKHGIIDDDIIKNIEKEPVESANTLMNKFHGSDEIKFNLLLLSIHFLPKSIVRIIIKYRLYKFFPAINPTLIESPMTMIMKDRFDIVRRRYYIRYWVYGWEVLWGKICKWVKRQKGKKAKGH